MSERASDAIYRPPGIQWGGFVLPLSLLAAAALVMNAPAILSFVQSLAARVTLITFANPPPVQIWGAIVLSIAWVR